MGDTETGVSAAPPAREEHTGANADGEARAAGATGGAEGVRTPLGTMAIVLIYAAGTVLLWAYVYYHMLRYGGGLGGH